MPSSPNESYSWQVSNSSPLVLEFKDKNGVNVTPQPLHDLNINKSVDNELVGKTEERRRNVLRTLRHVTSAIAAMSERGKINLVTKIHSPQDEEDEEDEDKEEDGILGLLGPPEDVTKLDSDPDYEALFSRESSSSYDSELSFGKRLELVLEESETLLLLDLPSIHVFIEDEDELNNLDEDVKFCSSFELVHNWAQTDNLCLKKKDTQCDQLDRSNKETQAFTKDFI